MLTIREAQMAVLAQVTTRRFEDDLLRKLKEFWPEDCESLGDDGVREVIRYGMQRGLGYGLVTEQQVFRYVNLMFLCGRDVDLQPWAEPVLSNPDIAGDAKLDFLAQSAMELDEESLESISTRDGRGA